MDAVDPERRQLGEVLLEAGLLSERDLAGTLAEQQRSGRRLGEILVARGLVSGAALGNALAEQHGRFLRTEYGFATGLGGLIGSRVAPASRSAHPDVVPPASTSPPSGVRFGGAPATAGDSAEAKSREADPAEVRDLAQPLYGTEAPNEPAAIRKMSSSEQRHADDLEVQTLPQPDPNHLLFVQIEISMDAVDPGRRQLGEVLLEAGREAEPAEVPDLAQPLHGTEAPNEPAAIRKMSSSEQLRADDLEVQTLPQPDPNHLLFVPTPGGYLLIQRIGEAPTPGQHLELPEAPNARLYVSKIARSPLPLDERICAYLQTL